jgi:hypothetical protein
MVVTMNGCTASPSAALQNKPVFGLISTFSFSGVLQDRVMRRPANASSSMGQQKRPQTAANHVLRIWGAIVQNQCGPGTFAGGSSSASATGKKVALKK